MARSGLPPYPAPPAIPPGRRDCMAHRAKRRTTSHKAREQPQNARNVRGVVLDRPRSKSRCGACTRVVRGARVRRRVPLSRWPCPGHAKTPQDGRRRCRECIRPPCQLCGDPGPLWSLWEGKEKPRTNPGRGSFEALGGAEEYAERQEQNEQDIGHAITSNVKTK